MRNLDTVRCVHEAVGRRDARHSGDSREPIHIRQEGRATLILRDQAASREALRSPALVAANPFADGFERLAERGERLPYIEGFFEHGALFLEGDAHQRVRRLLAEQLRKDTAAFDRAAAAIERLMLARRNRLRSALEFSRLFVELCMASCICAGTGRPFRTVLRVLRRRRNVFTINFHPARHRLMNDALREVAGDRATEPDDIVMLAVQSMMLMGFDPLVATLCAMIEDDEESDDPAARYCPVSLVTRRCIEDTRIGGVELHRGDMVCVSLVPARNEPDPERFPFGAGHHLCAGRQLSLRMIALGKRIIDSGFSEGFERRTRPYANGIFLGFQEEPSGPT